MVSPMNIRRLVLFLLVSCASAPLAEAQNWSGAGADQNWSTSANWVGGVAPSSGSVVIFPDGVFPVTTNAQGVVNNIVLSSITVASLTYNNNGAVNDFVTTSIPSGSI